MIDLLFRLLAHADRHPSVAYFASGILAVMGFTGDQLAKVASPNTLIQVPTVFRWCGYITIAASTGIALCTFIIQVSRVRRELRGISSAHPFGPTKRHEP